RPSHRSSPRVHACGMGHRRSVRRFRQAAVGDPMAGRFRRLLRDNVDVRLFHAGSLRSPSRPTREQFSPAHRSVVAALRPLQRTPAEGGSMIEAVASAWGRLIGRYGRKVVDQANVRLAFEGSLPSSPVVWTGWHELNLVTVALHGLIRARPALAFVPTG